MTPGGICRLLACRRGVSAVEMALVAPIFFGFVFGIVNLSMLLWTQASLHFAVQAAARCASVDNTNCGTPGAVQSYALAQYYGRPLGGTNPFSYAATGCGHTVNANYTYSMTVPFVGSYSVPLASTACFP